MRTVAAITLGLLLAGAATAAPRIWIEGTEAPEALKVSNDSGAAVRGCTAEWTISYGPDGHYTEIALVDLPAKGEVQVSDCANWWNQTWHKRMDAKVRLLGSDGAVLAEQDYTGVFKILARKGLPTDGWSAKSCIGGNVKAAFDDDVGTRWDTGRPMKAGDWYSLDMGKPQRVNGVIVDFRPSGQDFPEGLKVEVSTDGKEWEQVAKTSDLAVINKGGKSTLSFDPVEAQHIKLTIEKTHGEGMFWSIHELSVLAPDAQ